MVEQRQKEHADVEDSRVMSFTLWIKLHSQMRGKLGDHIFRQRNDGIHYITSLFLSSCQNLKQMLFSKNINE